LRDGVAIGLDGLVDLDACALQIDLREPELRYPLDRPQEGERVEI
jgi:hypothetical protein